MLMARLSVENVAQMYGQIIDRILKNLTTQTTQTKVGVLLRLGLVSTSVIVVATGGNPVILKAG